MVDFDLWLWTGWCSLDDEVAKMTRCRTRSPWRGGVCGRGCHSGWVLRATLRRHCGRDDRGRDGLTRTDCDGGESCAGDAGDCGRMQQLSWWYEGVERMQTGCGRGW